MSALRLFFILSCVFLVTGCTPDPRKRAEAELRNGGAERLRQDAALVYKEIFSGHGKPAFVEVWYKDWPASFQKLRPLHVGAYLDGISIALHSHDGGESGLYIVPRSMDHQPTDEHGAKFEPLADGVFWYSFHATSNAAKPVPP